MRRIGRSLALHTAVTGEMTIATSLGWDTGVVRTVGIDAGFGRPVAGVASKVRAIQEEMAKASFHGTLIQTFETTNEIAIPLGA